MMQLRRPSLGPLLVARSPLNVLGREVSEWRGKRATYTNDFLTVS